MSDNGEKYKSGQNAKRGIDREKPNMNYYFWRNQQNCKESV